MTIVLSDEETKESSALSCPRILVVEDDLALLDGIRDVLELADYEVITATNGAEALSVMGKEPPDLVISDIMMPQMDGLQLCERVRQDFRWAMLPFIFLTAKSQKADVRQGMGVGADDYLTKPFEMEDLLSAVASRLQRARSIKAETMERLAHLREDILRKLGHELRTPLTFIKGYTELLVESASEVKADDWEVSLQAIKAGSDRLSALVEDLVFLAGLETGEAAAIYEREKERLNLVKLVRDVLASLQEVAAGQNTILVDDLRSSLPIVIGHRAFLADALRRILENAFKFAGSHDRRVVVSGDVRANEVHIDVADNGVGIAENELPHVFDKFYQVNREKMEQRGVGLGLPIVKVIMEMHGGRVEVQSKLGQGSVFTLVLPLPSVS